MVNVPSQKLKEYFNRSGLNFSDFTRVSKEDLYHQIKTGAPIKLKNCYIENFSISEYRKMMNLEETERVEIQFDCIIGCVFINEIVSLDFSSCDFIPKDKVAGFDWEYNTFFSPMINFEASSFKGGDISFNKSEFYDLERLSFAFSYFSEGDITFSECRIEGSAEILIVNTKFKDIDCFEFKNNYADQAHLTFLGANINIEFLSLYGTHLNTVRFENTTVGANLVTFDDAEIVYFVIIQSTINCYMKFTFFHPEYAIIQNCCINGCLGIGYSEKFPTKYSIINSVFLGKLNFEDDYSNEIFSGQEYLFLRAHDEEEQRSGYRFSSFDSVYRKSTPELLSRQFRLVAASLRSEGRVKEADEAYLASRRHEREAKKEERILKGELFQGKLMSSMNSLIARLFFFIEFLVLDVFCARYATRPFRFILVAFFIIAFFAFVMVCIKAFFLSDPLSITLFFECFMDSVTLFFQIGDVSDISISYVALAEELIGLVLLALFSASFVRRIIN